MVKLKKARKSQIPAVIQPAEEGAGYMPVVSHHHCIHHGVSPHGSRYWNTPSRFHTLDKSIYLAPPVSYVHALIARELKEGCSDARLPDITNVHLYLLKNIICSAVVSILMLLYKK